jgi:steroid 5-alpha reductase family enzyme
VPSWVFFIFNVVFICFIQSMLLLSVTTPTYLILLASRLASEAPAGTSRIASSGLETWTIADLILSRALICCVLLAYLADQQQWQFQTAKQQYQKSAKLPSAGSQYSREDLDRGFVVSGLWAWSRHPNFAAEQAFWLFLYQWGCFTTNSTYNWSAAGALSYMALFQGSTWLTELISAGKYPDYAEYQMRVGRFVPRLGTEPVGEWKTKAKKSMDDKKKVVQTKNDGVVAPAQAKGE